MISISLSIRVTSLGAPIGGGAIGGPWEVQTAVWNLEIRNWEGFA